jgi:hypothetical protein
MHQPKIKITLISCNQNPSQYHTSTYSLVFPVVLFPLAFPPATISEETAMATKVYKKNSPTLADISSSNLTIHRLRKEV